MKKLEEIKEINREAIAYFQIYDEFIDICKNIEPNIALVIESKGEYAMYKWLVERDFRQYHKSLNGFDNWCKYYLLSEDDFYICCEILGVETNERF